MPILAPSTFSSITTSPSRKDVASDLDKMRSPRKGLLDSEKRWGVRGNLTNSLSITHLLLEFCLYLHGDENELHSDAALSESGVPSTPFAISRLQYGGRAA